MTVDEWETVTVDEWQDGARLLTLKLTVDERFPKHCDLLSIVYRDKIYRLRRDGNTLRLQGSRKDVIEFLDGDDGGPVSYDYGYYGYDNNRPKVAYKSLMGALSAYTMGLSTPHAAGRFELPDDRVWLLFFTTMPDEMFAQGTELGQPAGSVLFHHTILKPETP